MTPLQAASEAHGLCPICGAGLDTVSSHPWPPRRILRHRASSHLAQKHPGLNLRARSLMADRVVVEAGLDG